MTIELRMSGPEDRRQIIDMMDEARGENLTEEQRAERGWVQGRMNDELLAEFEAGTGVIVAEDTTNGRVAAFCVTSRPQVGDPGARGALVGHMESAHPDARWAMYGPVVIDPDCQGRGLMRRLLTRMADVLTGYDLGAAFVDTGNSRSMQVHRHYPFTEDGTYEFEGREIMVFTFSPAAFARDIRAS